MINGGEWWLMVVNVIFTLTFYGDFIWCFHGD